MPPSCLAIYNCAACPPTQRGGGRAESSSVTLASVPAFSRSRRAWPYSPGASRVVGAAGGSTGSAGLSCAQRELPAPCLSAAVRAVLRCLCRKRSV